MLKLTLTSSCSIWLKNTQSLPLFTSGRWQVPHSTLCTAHKYGTLGAGWEAEEEQAEWLTPAPGDSQGPRTKCVRVARFAILILSSSGREETGPTSLLGLRENFIFKRPCFPLNHHSNSYLIILMGFSMDVYFNFVSFLSHLWNHFMSLLKARIVWPIKN